MAATKTHKPRIYSNTENLRRAVRRAGVDDVYYRIHTETPGGRKRRLWPIFEPRNAAERRRVEEARFKFDVSY